jgi:hypothetical protein
VAANYDQKRLGRQQSVPKRLRPRYLVGWGCKSRFLSPAVQPGNEADLGAQMFGDRRQWCVRFRNVARKRMSYTTAGVFIIERPLEPAECNLSEFGTGQGHGWRGLRRADHATPLRRFALPAFRPVVFAQGSDFPFGLSGLIAVRQVGMLSQQLFTRSGSRGLTRSALHYPPRRFQE